MQPPVCVDASVVVRLLVPAPGTEAVAALWQEWTTERRRIVTSGLIGYEVTNALRRYEVLGALLAEDVNDALSIFNSLGLVQLDEPGLHAEALKLARAHGLKATYDAHYLATARRCAADLFTADARLARAVELPFVKLVA